MLHKTFNVNNKTAGPYIVTDKNRYEFYVQYVNCFITSGSSNCGFQDIASWFSDEKKSFVNMNS